MASQKYNILYGRLSQEDERQGESNSIHNQKLFLEKYAADNGFENTLFLADDGYSGTNFDRPSWKKIVEMIENGEVETLIVKGLSRLGREYLQVGRLTELYFPEKGVRFIAVNDNVDSLVESSNDFNPIRNWANELHAKDTSKKVRAIKKMQAERGERLGGKPPYGYKKKEKDSKEIVPDEETAPIVLDDLRRVTHFARMKERQFAQYINQKNTAELHRDINRLQKELDSMHRRYDELSVLFKRLYEDNVLGRVTNKQFRMLSADYNAEQKGLSSSIPAREEQLERLKASAANVDAFIEKAKRYTTIDELTPELLRLFIQRIEVGERSKKHSRSAGQSVRIVYRDIGGMDCPMQEGELAPRMTRQITDIEEIKRLLA